MDGFDRRDIFVGHVQDKHYALVSLSLSIQVFPIASIQQFSLVSQLWLGMKNDSNGNRWLL